jgi:acetolactate synthase regulatory subunit
MGVMLNFKADFEPSEVVLKKTLRHWGYVVAEGALNITNNNDTVSWHFVMVARTSRPLISSLFELSRQLRLVDGVANLQISHARN